MTSIPDRQLADWKEAVGKLGRVPQEWIGKTPDAAIPDRVRDRVLRTAALLFALSQQPAQDGDATDAA